MWPTDQRTDRRMDWRTDGPTKRGVESRSTRLKIGKGEGSSKYADASGKGVGSKRKVREARSDEEEHLKLKSCECDSNWSNISINNVICIMWFSDFFSLRWQTLKLHSTSIEEKYRKYTVLVICTDILDTFYVKKNQGSFIHGEVSKEMITIFTIIYKEILFYLKSMQVFC